VLRRGAAGVPHRGRSRRVLTDRPGGAGHAGPIGRDRPLPERPPRILAGPAAGPELAALLAEPAVQAQLEGFVVSVSQRPADHPEFRAELRAADGLLLTGQLTAPMMAAAPRLRVVSVTATGVATYVDLPAAGKHGITVTNVPGYGDVAVAEHTLALLLATARDLVAADQAVRQGVWDRPPGVELAGKVAGVVGYGGVGQRVAGLLELLGMTVLVWTRDPRPTRLDSTGQRFAELDELFRRADVVSLHLALGAGTRGLISEPMLRSMPVGSILVNTARAELIVPGALEQVLADGHLRAGLDVFYSEPLPAASGIGRAGNTVLSPHQAFHTPEATRRLLLGAVANLAAFFAGQPRHVVAW
jgi:D-3-phosphoglycerate dehydrogenase / 2-oxoglutarate reductase